MISTQMHVSYGQIAFFDGTLEAPFNDWTDRHVRQGFAWRDGSVSFRALADGEARVEFVACDRFIPDAESVRTISVPFVLPEGGRPEVATITESWPISLGPGVHQLVFEAGWSGATSWCRFSAIRGGDAEPRILVRDADLAPTFPLWMEADPA